MRNSKLTYKQQERIKLLREKGYRVRDISDRFSISIFTVYTITEGVKPKERRFILGG